MSLRTTGQIFKELADVLRVAFKSKCANVFAYDVFTHRTDEDYALEYRVTFFGPRRKY